MRALKIRRSGRVYADRPLPPQVMSNVLWAAFGVNRPASGGRTAPTAMGAREIDVYAMLPEGMFLYDALEHVLLPVAAGDFRSILAGPQDFVNTAPLCLTYVADRARYPGTAGNAASELHTIWASVASGAIAQNVYLCCASEGLSTVVRTTMDRYAFAELVALRPAQQITVNQCVGYPPAR